MCLLGNPKVGTTNNQLTIQFLIDYLAWTHCFFFLSLLFVFIEPGGRWSRTHLQFRTGRDQNPKVTVAAAPRQARLHGMADWRLSCDKMLQIWEVELNLPTKWLAGGNSNIFFICHPDFVGKWSNLTRIFFKWVETTNYRWLKIIYLAE